MKSKINELQKNLEKRHTSKENEIPVISAKKEKPQSGFS